MNIKSTIDGSWDIEWILQKLRDGGADNHIGWQPSEDGQSFELFYRGEHFDMAQGIIDTYETAYADEKLRPQLVDRVTEIRREKQLVANFGGMPLPADDTTVARITAAAYLMDADPNSPQTRRWKVGPNAWIDVDRNTLVAMGTTIANHMQDCFNQEETLHSQLAAAATVAELQAIDIEAGWPT